MLNLCYVCDLRFSTTSFDVSDLFFTSVEEEDDDETLGIHVGPIPTSSSKSKPTNQLVENRDSPSQKTDDKTPFHHLCDICLGVLKPKWLEKIGRAVVDQLESEKYDCSDFNLCVKFPGSCRVREIYYSLMQLAKNERQRKGAEKTAGVLVRSLPQLSFRDTARLYLVKEITRISQLKYSGKSCLTITVNLENEASDEITQEYIMSRHPELCKNQQVSRKRRANSNSSSDKTNVSNRFSIFSSDLLCFERVGSIDDAAEYFGYLATRRKQSTALTVDFLRDPLYLAGSYCKYSRFLAQSPFLIEGERVRESSVQEILCEPLLPIFGASEYRFMAAGREDVDVRMLGKGRPFAVVMVNPKREFHEETDVVLAKYTEELAETQNDVRALGMHRTDSQEIKILKIGEEEKTKTYTALCYCRTGVTEDDIKKLIEIGKNPVELSQRTPIRVLHRRNLARRTKAVLKMSAMLVDEKNFYLRVTTQAGTYIKEFVHGDFGRTIPSVADMLDVEEVDILELDVESVDLTWPPKEEWRAVEARIKQKVESQKRRRQRNSSSDEAIEG